MRKVKNHKRPGHPLRCEFTGVRELRGSFEILSFKVLRSKSCREATQSLQVLILFRLQDAKSAERRKRMSLRMLRGMGGNAKYFKNRDIENNNMATFLNLSSEPHNQAMLHLPVACLYSCHRQNPIDSSHQL
jgi:hypothetical protein